MKQWSRRDFGPRALAVIAVADGLSLRLDSLRAQAQMKSTEHDANFYPLVDAGVSTELHVYPAGNHAPGLIVPDGPISKRFTESWMSSLRRAFATA